MVHGEFSLLIILISLLSIYASIRLLKAASGLITIPYASSLFMYKYIFFIYIGAVLLNVFPFRSTYVFQNRPDLVLNIWYYTTASLFVMPISMLTANVIFQYRPLKSTKLLNSTSVNTAGYNTSFIFLVIFFSICVAILMLYISKLNELPIIGVLDGLSARELAVLRSDSGSNFTGKYYRYALFMKTMPFLLLLLVFFMKNHSIKWKLFFFTLLFYNIFVSVMDLQKAPVIQLFLALLLLGFYIRGRVNKKSLILTGIFLSILILTMFIVFMGLGERSFSVIISAILERIFIVQVKGFYYWQLFQETNGYIYGASFPNPAGIFPFEPRRITVEVMNFAHPELTRYGIVGSMPTVYFADWFINFGPIMAVFSMALLGFILQTLDIFFIRKLNLNKDLITSVLFLYIILYMSKFVLGSYVGVITDFALVIPILFLIGMNVIWKNRNA